MRERKTQQIIYFICSVTATITMHQLTAVLGKLDFGGAGYSVAVPGSTRQYIAAEPIVSDTQRTVGGSTGVFV